VNAHATLAVAARVLTQLRRDPRTLALLLLVPVLLVTLVKYVFERRGGVFQRIAPPMLGLFPLISLFLVTSITMLRERVSGTLERLMTMPLAKLDLLLGYALAFSLVAAVQATFVSVVAIELLGLELLAPVWQVVALAIANAVLGLALGLFVSAFARSEFQAVQFMPGFILPQIFLCGLFVRRAEMAQALEWISYALPLTYAYDALDRLAADADLGTPFVVDVGVVVGASLLALALGALTLRRRTP
jgi:ABC-2 type transport system permease protein